MCLIQIVEGSLQPGDKVRFFHAGKTHEVQEVGLLAPERLPLDGLRTGQVRARASERAWGEQPNSKSIVVVNNNFSRLHY